MNLSPARLAVIVALVVGGVAVLMNGFSGDGEAAAVGGTESPSPTVALSPSITPTPTTPATPTDTPAPEVDGVQLAVLNGTGQTGLAGEVEQLLTDEGYVAAQPADDAPTTGVAKTVAYYRGGPDAAQNKSNATNMAIEFLNDADVKLLSEEVDASVVSEAQVVVVLGLDYPDATA